MAFPVSSLIVSFHVSVTSESFSILSEDKTSLFTQNYKHVIHIHYMNFRITMYNKMNMNIGRVHQETPQSGQSSEMS